MDSVNAVMFVGSLGPIERLCCRLLCYDRRLGLLDEGISHHHLVVALVTRLLEYLPEYAQVCFNHRVVHRQIKGVVREMRTVVYPREKRLADKALLTLELGTKAVRINATEDLEIVLQDSPERVLDSEIRYVLSPDFCPQQ